MFIQTENTPSAETLTFILDQLAEPSIIYSLSKIEDVVSASLDKDRITLTKKPQAHWDTLKPFVFKAIEDHFAAQPIEETDPIVHQIREVLETHVRPLLAQDGGDVRFHAFKDGVVYVELQGACHGCPRSQETLKHGIGTMLRHFVPEVMEVSAVHA